MLDIARVHQARAQALEATAQKAQAAFDALSPADRTIVLAVKEVLTAGLQEILEDAARDGKTSVQAEVRMKSAPFAGGDFEAQKRLATIASNLLCANPGTGVYLTFVDVLGDSRRPKDWPINQRALGKPDPVFSNKVNYTEAAEARAFFEASFSP